MTQTLKPLVSVAEGTGVVTPSRPILVKAPRARGYSLDNPQIAINEIKMLVYGKSGAGKTFTFAELAAMGYKVALLSTDLGDSGHLTLVNYFRQRPELQDALKNICVIPLDGYREVTSFLRSPWSIQIDEKKTLAEFDPDFLGWDGFSFFQQIDISEYVGDMVPRETNKTTDRGDFRESGLVFETQDWGAVKNATMRAAKDFLSLKNPSGKVLHKLVTCFEDQQSKLKNPNNVMEGSILVDTYKPLLQGAGGRMLLAGFDVVLRIESTIRKADSGPIPEFWYYAAGIENPMAKSRGFVLEQKFPANMGHLFKRLESEILMTTGKG